MGKDKTIEKCDVTKCIKDCKTPKCAVVAGGVVLAVLVGAAVAVFSFFSKK